MGNHGSNRSIPPKDTFFIVRLLLQQCRAAPIGGRDMMINARGRLVPRFVAGAIETAGQIHILEISSERFGKATDMPQCSAPVERTGRTGAKDAAGGQVRRRERTTVTTFP